ncbi:MAG: hypothetical protein E6J14_14420 [Chloroflexi bacterium]|nr:MAG: hypothetical protein E6J14_14420 [Chloroflexota bacterium]
MAEPRPPSLKLTAGVGSASGMPGVPQRGGLLGWLLGSRPAPLAGIAEIDPEDIATGTDWSNYVHLPPGTRDGGGDGGGGGAPTPERLGICFSGGGIRAASFCLGGLEALRDHSSGYFEKACYLSAVSGGGYLAVAHAALLGLTRKHPPAGASAAAVEELLRTPPPWSLTAPETVNLRNHTQYLAPDLVGRVWGVSVILYGAIRRLLPFAALIVLLGTLYGWLLLALPHLRFASVQGSTPSIDLTAVRSVAIFGCGGVLALAALQLLMREGLERIRPIPPADTECQRIRRSATAIAGLAAAVGAVAATAGVHVAGRAEGAGTSLTVAVVSAVATVVIWLLWLVLRAKGRHVDAAHAALEIWTVRLVGLGVLAGVLFCLVPIVFSRLGDDVRHLTGAAGADLGLIAMLMRIAGRAHTAASTLRRVITLVAAYVAGPLVLLVGFLLVAYVSASRGPRWDGFDTAMWVVSSLAFLVAVWLLDDEVRAPLHILYRERLSTAFIRLRAKDTNGRITTAEPPWGEAIDFSTLDVTGMPRLVICASVNVNDDVVPPGRFVGVFTFEKERCGGPLTGYAPTRVMEEAAGEGVLTLPGMMAIAGAAFSPLMGRTTRPGWRLLQALFDVRLGMWLPNPRWLPDLETARRRPLAPVASSGMEQRLTRRRSRFLAQQVDVHTPPDVGTPPARLRPGWSYSLREAFGGNSLRLPYVYVTDGGHWENLGLVELLRRGCTRIVCFDASEDRDQPLSALGQAMTLAKDELNVTVEVEVDELWPGSAHDPKDPRRCVSMCARGRIRYPDGRTGRLVIVKNHLPKDVPVDVRTYAESDARFPMDSTLDQFFDDQRFDAYRSLGYHGAMRAAAILDGLGGTLEDCTGTRPVSASAPAVPPPR